MAPPIAQAAIGRWRRIWDVRLGYLLGRLYR